MANAQTIVGSYQYKDKLWAADPLPKLPKVEGHNANSRPNVPTGGQPAGSRELRKHAVAAPKWPAATTGTLTPGGSSGPVSVAQAAVGAQAQASTATGGQSAPAAVKVETADHGRAQAANVDGLLVGLERADGQDASGSVSVSVDYGSFAQAYGGGWASRLHLVQMPACALTTPQYASCRMQKPLETVNDPVSHKLTATVVLPSSSAPQPAAGSMALDATASTSTAVAAVAGTGGSQGSYAATSLSASGSWASATGAFTYGYPIDVPPSLGGTAPSVGLSYNSQSVDGKTSARNSQASWIGDGWDYSPGFIERSYKSCANDGIANSGDECWAGYNATMSLGSRNGQLVRDGNGVYHLQNDDGTKIEDLSGASNGLWNGEYFKVTTTDGTQYYFGLNHAPGTTSDAATNSAWGVPVYFPNPGDPCYSASAGKSSQCPAQPGYRFNLDFVVDAHGNLQRYDWANETNYYNMGYGQVAASGNGGTLTPYTRAGYLTQISYGYQLADEQAGKEPAAKVVFNPTQRCVTDPTTCQASNLSPTTATNWPDVPYNLNCTSGMATSGSGSNVCQVASPTYWSTVRLQSINTSVKVGSAWQSVDSYALTHLFSDAGGTADPVTGKTVDPADAGQLQSVMWLSQIQRTGQDTSAGGSGTVTLDPVTFTGIEMSNRVDGSSPPAPPLYRPRISSIQTETGESIAVTYRAPECSRVNNTMPASSDSDTMACFQVYWSTPGAAAPIADWFNKTLVAQVSDNDLSKAGSPAKITNYTYSGGAAWHRDDSDLTDDQYRTWNDFRGYRTVTTTTGAAPDPVTQTTVSYLQGMDGDYKADGTQRSVSLTNSLGEATTDSSWLAGAPQESDTYSQAGGTVVGKAVTSAPTFTTIATQSRTAWTSKSPAPTTLSMLPPVMALRVQSTSSRSLSLLANNSWRTTQTNSTFDSLGRPSQADDKGDVSVPAQENCTTTSYANAPASNPMMLSFPSEIITVAGPCGTAAGTTTTMADKRIFYDGDGTVTNPGTLGTLGQNGTSVGNSTSTQSVTSYDSSGNPVFQTLGAVSYDRYGRVTRSLDAAGSATTTAYTPVDTTLPTGVSTTNPLNWSSSSTIAPARSLVTHAVDANGKVTDSTYDPLGRRTAVWLPGRAMATQSADRTFSYAIHGAGTNPDPSSVTTNTLREDGTYRSAIDIYDGFLAKRQTQTICVNNLPGCRLVSSTRYDSHGWAVASSAPWADTTTGPSTTLYIETENTLPSETVTTYDGTGRSTASALNSKAAKLWQSTTAYPGADETDTAPPSGGTPTSVFTDARGRTTSSVKHGGASGDVTTSYTYAPTGQVSTVTDKAGNTWSYGYDVLGRKTSQTDPDTGSSTTAYDNLGRVSSTTDGRGQTLSYSYDVVGRRTGEYAGTSTTDPTKQLAGWTYDTLQKGYQTSSTRYVGGSGTGGSAYVQQVTGYNTAYQPTGTSVTIPAAEGNLAGTYSLGADYTTNVGLLAHSNYNADGGLPAEALGYGYDLQGELVASGSGRFNHYLDVANYSPLGQILQSTYGNSGVQFRTAQTYDNATGRLTTNRDSIQTLTANPISNTTYGYDQVGNISTVSEGQSSGGADLATDTQCFQYDGLDRLTTAWTDTAGATSPTAGQLATCTTAAPAPATIGGPAPYWQTWQYNLLGDRTQQVNHDVTGNTAKDVTQTLAYPGSGATKANQPNTASTVTTTGPTGTSTQTPQYDPAGNTVSRATTGATSSSQSFCYDTEGRTQAVSTTNCSTSPQTSYLYDADGGLLIQRGPANNVLYLFGGAEQLTLNNSTNAVTGLRYYHNPDGTTIVRSSTGTVTYQPTNPQGTSQLQVDANSLAITRRSYDPYGNARGPAPSAWADNHGYLGQPTDTTTGLNLLGARNYDPTLGRFLTADPIFEAGDPNQMGGYTYAANNPTTGSDPNGLITRGGDDAGFAPCGMGSSCGPAWPAQGSLGDWAVGVSDGSSDTACNLLLGTSALCQALDDGRKKGDSYVGINTNSPNYQKGNFGGSVAANAVAALIDPEADAEVIGLKYEQSLASRLASRVRSLLRRDAGAAGEISSATSAAEAASALETSQAARNAMADAAHDAEGSTLKTSQASPEAPVTPTSGPGTSRPAGAACSFTPDTPVLLSGGATKPIGDLKPGDSVEAADPKTGEHEGPRAVLSTYVNHDDDLIDITIGAPDGKTAIVHTTYKHPFWDDTRKTWVRAGQLPDGDELETATNTHVLVLNKTVVPGAKDMYNLTVDQLHTYYVLAGTTPVLVHNTNGQICDLNDGYLYRGVAEGHTSYSTAAEGVAVPRGTHTNILDHTGGNATDSAFTSWSDEPETAEWFAQNLGDNFVGKGVMLRVRVASIEPEIGPSRIFQTHGTDYERFEEEEHLVYGKLQADDISFDFGETWTPVGRR